MNFIKNKFTRDPMYEWMGIPAFIGILASSLRSMPTVLDVRLDVTPYTDAGPLALPVEVVGTVALDTTRNPVPEGRGGSAAFSGLGYLLVSASPGSTLVLRGRFSIVCWVWIDSSFDGHASVWCLNSHTNGIMMYYSPDGDTFIVNNIWHTKPPGTWPRDRWVLVVVTRNSSNRMVATVDGVAHLDVTYAGTINTNSTNAKLWIGSTPHRTSEQMLGNVASFVLLKV
jgi:hypothetical protein